MRTFLANYGAPSRRHVVAGTYEKLQAALDIGAGVYVFADLERLSGQHRRLLGAVCDQLEATGRCRILNHPARSLMRFPLLKTLAAREINQFRVYSPAERAQINGFPVFVRYASDHNGARSGLLPDRESLDRALAQLSLSFAGDPVTVQPSR